MKKIVAIILAVMFFIIMFFLLSLLSGFKNKLSSPPTSSTTPTPVAPIIKEGTQQGIFDSKNFTTYYKIAQERPDLFPKDAQIRKTLVGSLGNKTGILFEDSTIQIAYLKSADDFEVEIKKNDISTAEQKAVSFFAKEGLSVDGVCKLPLFFFATPDVLQYLKDNNQKLRVTPYFCENLKL